LKRGALSSFLCLRLFCKGEEVLLLPGAASKAYFRFALAHGWAPIAYLSEQIGHSSMELTVTRYGHLTPRANRQFINDLPGAM
jgi:hypothetical protein